MNDLSKSLKKEVEKICKSDGSLHISNFVRDSLKPKLLTVEHPSSDGLPDINLHPKSLIKLEEKTSPELQLRFQELKELIVKCQTNYDTKKLLEDFQEYRKARSLSLLEDKELADAYGKRVDSNSSDIPKASAKIYGVVLRRSPKYVSMINLDGSKEFLVEIGDPFCLLEVKIKVGDILSVVVNPNLKKTKDLNPELLGCFNISKDEVTTFFQKLKQLRNNPCGILGEFGRSLAVWKYILDEAIMKEEEEEEEDQKWHGEKQQISKNILEICKIFSDLQTQTQMTTVIKSFWNAFENSKFFNEVLPEIMKDEEWGRENVHLVQIFLENLLKVYPECAVRATGILECLAHIPESGVDFSQKLFAIIAPFVAGVSEKTEHLKWNQKSVIPLPTELQHDPKDDYKDLQSVRVKKEEVEEEKRKDNEKKGNESTNETAYKSEEEYIKTYYTLLREECFHKGKKGIHSFLVKGKCDPKDNMLYCVKLIGISDLNQLSIHEGLSLVLEYHSNSQTSEAEDSDPDNSKWLMLGNLVCLLLDVSCKNPVWGIISKERKAEDR